MRVEYNPLTVVDINKAAAYYDDRCGGLGSTFRLEVYVTIDRIIEHPKAYMETDGLRRALVKRFPYSVVYRLVSNQCVRILVVRHHKQNPTFGKWRH